MKFDDVLKDCRNYLFDRRQFKAGGIDLTSPSKHHFTAYSNMYRNHHNWLRLHSPFNRYVDRVVHRVLRNLGPKIDLVLINPVNEAEVRVRSVEDLETALQSGFQYRPGQPSHMMNPCSEIALNYTELSNLHDSGMYRVHIGGSPFSKHIVPGQMRLVIRHIYRFIRPADRYTPVMEALPYVDLNQRALRRLTRIGAPVMMNELFYSFYSQTRQPQWWHQLRQLKLDLAAPDSTELYSQFVAAAFFDAIPKGEGFDKNWRTATVVQMVESIWKDEAFDQMPILADALQDAGCDNEELLAHLRDVKAEHTLGSWVFRCMGKLK